MAAVVVLAAVIIATIIALGRGRGAVPGIQTRGSSIGAELDRCRDLGPAAEDDAACRETWRGNREHFFGHDAPERRP